MSQLFDPETGEVDVQGEPCPNCTRALEERVEAEVALQVVERKLTQSLAQEARLRTELEKQRIATSEGKTARALGRYWVARCGKNRKTTKLGEKRMKAVIARLNEGHTPAFIARAIDGVAEAATVSDAETQRQALLRVMHAAIEKVDEETAAELRAIYREATRSVQVYNDLELVCRDEVKLERFHEIAERIGAPTLVGPAWLKEFGWVEPGKDSDAPF